MKWKAWIFAMVLLAGVCLAVDQLFTQVFIFSNPLSDADRIRHLFQDNSDAIPIFGTSKAHGHYCPADMGIKAFNYGMNGISYEVTDVFLQIELAKSRTTPIILELQYRDTGILGDQTRYIPFARDPRFHALLEKFHTTSWRYYVPAIRYFGYYDALLRTYLNGPLKVEKMQDGFSELVHPPAFNRAQLDEYIRERLAYTNGYFPEGDQNERLIAHITEHPQRLFFLVISPFHPSYYVNFRNEDKFEAFKKQLAALPNVVLLDWGRKHYPDEDFLDTLHLRRPAAAKFSRELGEKIRQILQERNGRNTTVNTVAK